ncbi:MAG: C25 family cysteine peptidase [Pyrinomonadaceae bacterium]
MALASNAANLVIISHKSFLPQAENWATYRRGQGFTVKVVEVSEIYDEFNYGVLSSDSIKSFLDYSKNNWQTAPGYVLIIGDASYDSRNYQGFGYLNLVPTRIVNTIFTETGSDDFLADFNSDGLSEMAVGRIPVREAQAVTNALAKVSAYELAAQTMQSRGVLFAYDLFDANNNYDFQAISTRIRNQLPPAVPVTMIGRGDTPAPPDTSRTILINAMNTGKYVINYSGHGLSGGWASSGVFFSIFDVPLLTNANNQSIYTMLTCLNGFFMQPNRSSLAEILLDASNGGAVASWASTGETTPFEQEVMASRFYLNLGVGPHQRLGDLINDSKIAIPGGVDVRLSWALIGDPMLKVRNASTGDRQQ